MSDHDIKALLDEQGKVLQDFREANDELQEQVKKLGSEDAATREKVEKANEAVTRVTEELEKLQKEREKEHEAKEALEAELKQAKEDVGKIQTAMSRPGAGMNGVQEKSEVYRKNAIAFWNNDKTVEAVRHNGVEPSDESFDAYIAEFKKMLRKGPGHATIDEKALSVGVESDGGYWVEPEMDSRIVTRVFETSPIRQVAGVTTIGTDALEMITDTNDATSGGWVGEQASRTTTATPKVGKIRIPVHEQFAFPEITQKLLDDAAFNVEMWLADKIADRLARTENTAFVTGTGVDQPHGFVASDRTAAAVNTADASRAWGVLEYVFTGASAGYDTSTVDGTASPADELLDLVFALKPIYRNGAVFLMSRTTEAETRKIKDADGNYVMDRNTGNINETRFGFNLLGFPVVGAEDMPAIAADSFSVAFGNFQVGYQIVDRMGIRVLRDPFTNKPFIGFYTTKRVGGDIVNWDAIKLLKFGTS